MPNIIDELIVLLKLDSTPYKKGSEDAVRATKATGKQVTSAAEDMTKGLVSVAKAASLAFLGFETLKGAVKFLDGVNTSTAALGRNAANIGASAHDVQTYGLAIEQVGGKSEEALQSFTEFAHEASDFKFGRGIGPMLQLFQNIGLSIRDSKGQLKDFNTLFQEAGGKIHERFPQRQDAHNIAVESGISEGLFNLLYDTNQKQILGDASKSAFADAAKIGTAQQIQRQKEALKQKIVGAVSGVALNAEGFALDFVSHPQDETINSYYRDLFNSASDKFRTTFGIPAARSIRNNNPGNIKALGSQKRDADGFRVFTTLAEGESALNHQLSLYDHRDGVNTIRGIVQKYEGADAPGNHNDIQAYIKSLTKATGKGADEKLSYADRFPLIEGIERVEAGAKGYKQLQAVKDAGKQASATAGAGTKVTVGTVNVNVPAGSDGAGIAAGFLTSVNRVASNAQANTGITP